jgi:cold shock protein
MFLSIMTGTIKTLIPDKNFGFITPEDGAKDLFFHATSLNGVEFTALKQGDKVSFDVEQSEKGPRAVNVTLA